MRHSSMQGQQDDENSQSRGTRQPTTPEPSTSLERRVAGEFIGTLLLVLFTAGMAATQRVLDARAGVLQTAPDVLYVALGQGLTLFVLLLIVGKVSGALINPAVTLALAGAGRFKLREVVPYLLAQFGGAVLGAALIPLLLGSAAGVSGRVGALTPDPGVSLLQASAVEAAGTFLLLLAITALAEDPRAPSGWAPLGIGMTLAVAVVLFAPVTGAGLNPARALGPDFIYALFFSGTVNWLTYLVAYLVGPIVGGSAAVWLYRFLARLPEAKPLPE